MSTANFQHSSGFIEKASIDDIIKKNRARLSKIQQVLNIFKQAEKGDKLMKNTYYIEDEEGKGEKDEKDEKEEKEEKDENISKYYLIKSGTMQPIWRWWYGESQENTFKYIEDEMNAFIKFLDDVLRLSEKYFYYSTFQKFVETINALITDILPGLYSFKQTYPKYQELISLVDSVILTLLDFKNTSKVKNKINKRVNSREKRKPPRKLSL